MCEDNIKVGDFFVFVFGKQEVFVSFRLCIFQLSNSPRLYPKLSELGSTLCLFREKIGFSTVSK